MKLYVMRHTEAEHNQKGVINADPSIGSKLTQTGLLQAKGLAEQTAAAPIEVMYVSEFERTQQTASIINEHHHVPIIVDARLNELRIGFEGQSHEAWRDAKANSTRDWTFRIDGAESLADGYERTKSFIDELLQSDYRHVAIVTHGYVVLAIQSIVDDFSLEQKYLEDHDPGVAVPQGEVIELSV